MVEKMKKTIISILIIALLILGGKTITSTQINIEKENQNESKVQSKNYDFIDPTFFKTWEHRDFEAAFGYRSLVYNHNIYQIVRLGQIEEYVVINDTICVVKYDSDTGEILNVNVFDEKETAGPHAILEYNNQILVLGSHTYRKEKNNSFVISYDLNLNLNNIYYILNSKNFSYSPIDMISDGENLYITGTVKKNEENAERDIFVAKFNSKLELVWNTSWDYNKKNQDMSWTASIIDIDDNYVYVTGELGGGKDGFLLKISIENGSLDFVIEEHVYEGCSVDTAGGKIYVSYTFAAKDGSNIKLCAYDEDLNLSWSKIFDIAQEDVVDDMLATEDFIYITGTAVEFDPEDPLNSLVYNAYILKYDLKDECEDWTKLVKEKASYGFSINADEDSLYLSGSITKIIGLRLYSFVLKCSKEGKDKSKIDTSEKIEKNKKFLRILNKVSILFPNIGILLKKILDTVKKDFFTNYRV